SLRPRAQLITRRLARCEGTAHATVRLRAPGRRASHLPGCLIGAGHAASVWHPHLTARRRRAYRARRNGSSPRKGMVIDCPAWKELVMRRISRLLLLALALTADRAALAGSLADLLGPGNVVVDPLRFQLERGLARGLDFPATATTPGFTYQYDPALGDFRRTSASLGPAFLERADTVGKGRFDVGLSMLYAAPDEIDGRSIDGSSRTIISEAPGFVGS